MKKNSIILLILVIFKEFCNAYDYPKPELKFDCEDTLPSPAKPKILRGVFFYTFDDNYEGREVEMHELNLESFNKLVSTLDYVKSPTAVKSTFNFIEFFDGRCQASVNCERIPQECPSIPPCSRTTSTSTSTTIKPPTKSSTRLPATTSLPPTTTTPEPPKPEVLQKVSTIFTSLAPQLTEQQLDEIIIAHEHLGPYTQNWTGSQLHEILLRSSEISQNVVQSQNTSANAVMKFSDEIKQVMINYTREIDPSMSLENILGMIEAVEEIGTAAMRYLTFDQFRMIRMKTISELARNNDVVVGTEAITTTRASTTAKASTTSLSITSTTKSSTTTTSKPPTTTKKPQTTTKTYVPPPGSSRKPYTRWVGQTYKQFTGQYSFAYSWKPYTGGRGSWRFRTFTDGTTTSTERYRQKELQKAFNPVENN